MTLQPGGLTCEHADRPIGLNTAAPWLGWQAACDRRSARQTAFEVQVASSAELLADGQADLWQSGRVGSGVWCGARYAGRTLGSRRRCWWRVRLWDEGERAGPWSEPTWFETGLTDPSEWRGQWLGHPAGWSGRALHFRCPFEVDFEVRRATAWVAGIGCHELYVNGQKVGDAVLDPAPTTYSRRVLYATHDITAMVGRGANALGVIVGHGWYGMAKLSMQVALDRPDGSTLWIVTERREWDRWQVAAGPITRHSLYDGEAYDARRLDAGWATADYRESAAGNRMRWTMSAAVEPPGGVLVGQTAEPMRVVESRAASGVTEPRPGVYVFDFGTNMAGWAKLTARGRRGASASIRFAETLGADGTVNQENLRTAEATDTFTFAGEGGAEAYEPRFTYHGFRYAQVEGLAGRPDEHTLVARQVRSDVRPRGRFACGHDLLNRIHAMVVQTEASNLHGIPTDCPQRAERMGWLNDLTARSEQALLNFDLSRMYGKFVDDIADAQDRLTGAVPDTVPFRWGHQPGDPVDIALLLIPWQLWQHHGEGAALERHYEAMRAWVGCLDARSEGGVLAFTRWGDWAEPSGDWANPGSPVSQRTPGVLVSTAFLSWHWRLLGRIGRAIGREAASADFRRADAVAAAFHARFWDAARGTYGTGSQACLAIPLALGVVPADRVDQAVAALVRQVEEDGSHLTTGNIATKYLLEVLSEHGRHDLACRIATRSDYPSWGFMLEHGATTLWERWEHATGGGMNSHNHPMYGSVGSWLYRYVAGWDLHPEAVGSDRLRLRPRPRPQIAHARAEVETPRGPSAVGWRITGDRLMVDLTVPCSAKAELCLPWGAEGRAVTVREGGAIAWARGEAGPASIEGATHAEPRADGLWVELGSGTYAFELHPWRPEASDNTPAH